jgi:signal transduction histidine kinase
MQDVMSTSPALTRSNARLRWAQLAAYLPRGNTLDEKAWQRRHRMIQWVLALHVPGLVALGLLLGHPGATVVEAVAVPVAFLVTGHLIHHRRWASFFITGGLVFCSMSLVLLSRGSIEAHFHFFIIIGFIALYQDWVPFLWNVAFTILSHGIGTIWLGGQIFNHPAAQQHPWLWSFIHGIAVLFACVGMVIFWRVTEDEQTAKEELGRQLITADVEIVRRQFTSDMLINLARRNQSMLYRQLDIINQLEDKERDPDALAELFKLDHLATRVRRNAESLLVLAGEQAPRTWSAPVGLRDVVRAAIAETEDLDRVVFAVDDRVAVSGSSVADLTHLLAELTENAVRFSPPETVVTIRARPNRRDEGGQILTVEDWGVGMPPKELDEANDLLARPREVDLAVSQRLGFHVVARLAARHGITVSLGATPGSGITAVVLLPSSLFTDEVVGPMLPFRDAAGGKGSLATGGTDSVKPAERSAPATPDRQPGTAAISAPFVDARPDASNGFWHGWWSPETPAPFGDAVAAHGGNGRSPYGGVPPVPSAGEPHGGRNGVVANGAPSNGAPSNDAFRNGSTRNDTPSDTAPSDAAPNGVPRNGSTPDDAAANESAVHGAVRNGAARDDVGHNGPNAAGTGVNGADVNGAGATRPPTPRVPPVRDAPPTPDVPSTRRPQPSPVGRTGVEPDDAARPEPTVSLPLARNGSGSLLAGRPTPLDLPGLRGPVAALPSPRPDDSVLDPTPTHGLPAGPGSARSSGTGRGLRRRVPQSHLAPELRHTANGLAETAAPLAADAAASALSRYQASRRAAQSVVAHADGPRDTEGEQG